MGKDAPSIVTTTERQHRVLLELSLIGSRISWLDRYPQVVPVVIAHESSVPSIRVGRPCKSDK